MPKFFVCIQSTIEQTYRIKGDYSSAEEALKNSAEDNNLLLHDEYTIVIKGSEKRVALLDENLNELDVDIS